MNKLLEKLAFWRHGDEPDSSAAVSEQRPNVDSAEEGRAAELRRDVLEKESRKLDERDDSPRPNYEPLRLLRIVKRIQQAALMLSRIRQQVPVCRVDLLHAGPHPAGEGEQAHACRDAERRIAVSHAVRRQLVS